MAFIEKIIGPDEKLVGVSTIHWMYAAIGIMWMAGFMMLGLWLNSFGVSAAFHFPGNPGLNATGIMSNTAFLVCAFLGVLLFLLYFVMMLTTEIGLTTKRIIYKRGWIFVSVNEADLEEMKAVGVNNGWFGRFLNYGYIELDARFINNMSIPAIADPYRFVKAANEIRSNLKQDSMTVVLDERNEVKSVEVENAQDGEANRKKNKARVSEVPVRDLNDPEYAGLSNDPAENIKQVMTETRQYRQRVKHDLAQQLPAVEAQLTAQPDAAAQHTGSKPEGGMAKAPIVFEKENLKDELKERIIENFSDIAEQKSA